jgi:uncharacterized cupin superfamily protein
MMPDGVAFARLDPDGADQRFQRLRGAIGVTSFGINLIVLEPGQRGRVHRHGPWELVRVGPEVRRQLVNRGSRRLVLLALGGRGEHAGRDGIAWADWDEAGDGRPPQEVPLPEDEPPRPSG